MTVYVKEGHYTPVFPTADCGVGVDMNLTRRLTRAYTRWSEPERQELLRLVFEENLTFLEIERLMGRSSEALRLQLGTLIENVDWTKVTPHVPAAVDPSLDEVARLVIAGSSPADIAIKFPTLFIEYVDGIIQLWQVINKKNWRYNS